MTNMRYVPNKGCRIGYIQHIQNLSNRSYRGGYGPGTEKPIQQWTPLHWVQSGPGLKPGKRKWTITCVYKYKCNLLKSSRAVFVLGPKVVSAFTIQIPWGKKRHRWKVCEIWITTTATTTMTMIITKKLVPNTGLEWLRGRRSSISWNALPLQLSCHGGHRTKSQVVAPQTQEILHRINSSDIRGTRFAFGTILKRR